MSNKRQLSKSTDRSPRSGAFLCLDDRTGTSTLISMAVESGLQAWDLDVEIRSIELEYGLTVKNGLVGYEILYQRWARERPLVVATGVDIVHAWNVRKLTPDVIGLICGPVPSRLSVRSLVGKCRWNETSRLHEMADTITRVCGRVAYLSGPNDLARVVSASQSAGATHWHIPFPIKMTMVTSGDASERRVGHA